MPRDTQVVELAGRHWLIGHLLSLGLEVAEPVRDRGVDLVVYEERSDVFRALPIQVKASSFSGFGVHNKYRKARNLLLAYVWNVRPEGPGPCAMVLTVNEAEKVVSDMGWARAGKTGYSTTAPSKRLRSALIEYISTRERWASLLRGGSHTLTDMR